MSFPRVRAMIFVAVLFVTAGVVVVTAINRDSQLMPPQDPCEPGQIRVNVDVPDEEQVTVNVYNGTDRTGLAEQISNELANRGFTTNTMEGVPEGGPYTLAGYIIFGPEGVGAAWLVSAYFLEGEYDPRFDKDKQGPEVDLILGADFQQLTTQTEVNQRIAELGQPQPPDGTCAA
ncbi:MAG: LytR C-terminal domain-containing protein [Micromonosporaceae bacterium]|nr:LytR C-terminal domain-containing protein [Micromonosporaceae bacterium]